MKPWQSLILAACLGLCGCSAAGQAESTDGLPVQRKTAGYQTVLGVGHLGAAELTEASGLAASRQTAGVLWAVNDSGNAPELFALGPRGEDRGTVRVAGVKNIDWEDLASFSWQGQAYLLVADVGDNRAIRQEVLLHVVPEPQPGSDGRFSGTVAPAWSLRVRFEDGSRDCEAVAVDPQQGQIWLLSKRTSAPILYRLPLRPTAEGQPQTARRTAEIGNIPAPDSEDLAQVFGRFRSWPTALDIRADGRAAVILTYKDAYLYLRHGTEPWEAALARTPQILRLPAAELLPQREAICFSDDNSLLVTSEGQGAGLYRLPTGPIDASAL
ncbi:hypothetical protein Pcar_3022 [Syntrophotalea carbinolica DSM 2380]|uniref:Uncharacterized protein n=1 Tax=Syntrophotalea carbinolica (strain DSM 2380 / NBRC 103641 / GraBd1) TaxID=338963 RepID=Q3A050_SYNC1|nr:hypothetical protein [Syntrophotalea carbinolica]ABA90257.1 hypothetical protein Pcar_3022 [Syntrophotalea carbinolica DSM 2380]